MITLRRAADRGRFDFGWLDTRHTFSFGEYHDPEHMGFRALRVIASSDARQGSLTVHQDVDVYSSLLGAGESVRLPLRPGRHAWVQVARGVVGLDGQTLSAGDGAALSDETAMALAAREDAEVLVFDLA